MGNCELYLTQSDEFGEEVWNEVELDGYLSDANTLKAARLYVREKDKDKIDFDPEDGTQFITFKKQSGVKKGGLSSRLILRGSPFLLLDQPDIEQ